MWQNLGIEILSIIGCTLDMVDCEPVFFPVLCCSGYGCSPLEIAFMWMGRWRPTSAVVLVYSTMGVHINLPEVGKISDVAMDQRPRVSPSLNEKQLSGLSALQEYVSKEEAELSKQLNTIQVYILLMCPYTIRNQFIKLEIDRIYTWMTFSRCSLGYLLSGNIQRRESIFFEQ